MTIPLDLPRIIKELNLDVPIYHIKAHDDCVELHLYGGKVVTWKPKKGDQFPVTGDLEMTPIETHISNRDSLKGQYCHVERSETSKSNEEKTLRCAQGDKLLTDRPSQNKSDERETKKRRSNK